MAAGKEINLMEGYPKSKRDISGRLTSKTKRDKLIAQKFGKEFFDGSRNHGYGGFSYNPRFWQPVVPTFQKYWNLKSGDSLLDIGCAKGFMLYDLKQSIPGINCFISYSINPFAHPISNNESPLLRFQCS